MRKVKRIVSATPKFKVDPLKDLQRIDELNNSHPAKEYLLNRKLPTEVCIIQTHLKMDELGQTGFL